MTQGELFSKEPIFIPKKNFLVELGMSEYQFKRFLVENFKNPDILKWKKFIHIDQANTIKKIIGEKTKLVPR